MLIECVVLETLEHSASALFRNLKYGMKRKSEVTNHPIPGGVLPSP